MHTAYEAAARAQVAAVRAEYPHQRGPTVCIFTGDDLAAPAPGIDPARIRPRAVPPFPTTPRAVWEPAPRDEALQRLAEWRTRCTMPEELGGVGGFAAERGGGGGAPRADDAAWTAEGKWREQDSTARLRDKQAGFAAGEREVGNKARKNAFGDPLPPRPRTEVFAPWAERA